MNIVNIFAVVEESLYTVQYEQEEFDEFTRLFRLWNDPEYLEAFFEEHKADLQSDFWGGISVEEAVLKNGRDAKRLERKLLEMAERGKADRFETLSTLFRPLHNDPVKIQEFEKNKVKGMPAPSWLRIYAIRIKANLFVVSGGAIKLTRTMNEREHLLEELRKLEYTRQLLAEDEDFDHEIFELF